jgi:hypothetical protein
VNNFEFRIEDFHCLKRSSGQPSPFLNLTIQHPSINRFHFLFVHLHSLQLLISSKERTILCSINIIHRMSNKTHIAAIMSTVVAIAAISSLVNVLCSAYSITRAARLDIENHLSVNEDLGLGIGRRHEN